MLVSLVVAAFLLEEHPPQIEGRAEISGQPARIAFGCAFETEDHVQSGRRRLMVVLPSEAPPKGISCREALAWMKRRESRETYSGLRADILMPSNPRGEYRWEDGELLEGGQSHGLSFYGLTFFQRDFEDSREVLRGRLWTTKPLVAGKFPAFFIDIQMRVSLERLPPAGLHLRGLKAASHPASAVVKLALLAMSVGNMRGVRSHLLEDEEVRKAFDLKMEKINQDPSARKAVPLMGGVGLMMPVKAVVDLGAGGLTRVTIGPPGGENTEDAHFLLRKVQGKWRLIEF